MKELYQRRRACSRVGAWLPMVQRCHIDTLFITRCSERNKRTSNYAMIEETIYFCESTNPNQKPLPHLPHLKIKIKMKNKKSINWEISTWDEIYLFIYLFFLFKKMR
jgi:hypothetical protein